MSTKSAAITNEELCNAMYAEVRHEGGYWQLWIGTDETSIYPGRKPVLNGDYASTFEAIVGAIEAGVCANRISVVR